MFFISFNARFSLPSPLLSVNPFPTPDASQPLNKYFNCGLFNSSNPSPPTATTVVVIVAVNAQLSGRSVKNYVTLCFKSTTYTLSLSLFLSTCYNIDYTIIFNFQLYMANVGETFKMYQMVFVFVEPNIFVWIFIAQRLICYFRN